jgi:site-specific DNA-methyltransferase (adenine-specific)
MDYLRAQPDFSFDLAIVDPPYGLDKKSTHGRGKLKDRILNEGHIQEWDERPGEEYFAQLRRVCRHLIIWGGNYFPLPPTRCFVAWDKRQPWENFSQVELAWTNFDKPSKLISLSNFGGRGPERAKIHPTQKPVALYTYLLERFAQPGMRVLDTHLGSGSSRIAARRFGVDFVGIEKNPEYFRQQEERYQAVFGLFS